MDARHSPVAFDAELHRKLIESRRSIHGLERRAIHCPRCGYHIMDAYGHEHVVTIVKCQKCKFCEPLDLRLFRTIKGISYKPNK